MLYHMINIHCHNEWGVTHSVVNGAKQCIHNSWQWVNEYRNTPHKHQLLGERPKWEDVKNIALLKTKLLAFKWSDEWITGAITGTLRVDMKWPLSATWALHIDRDEAIARLCRGGTCPEITMARIMDMMTKYNEHCINFAVSSYMQN